MKKRYSDEVEQTLKDLKDGTFHLFGVTYYEWEEGGKMYSGWKINTGKMTVNTGDGGMRSILKEFYKRNII